MAREVVAGPAPRSSNPSIAGGSGRGKAPAKQTTKARGSGRNKRSNKAGDDVDRKGKGRGKLVLPYSKRVSRRTVTQSWRALSSAARASVSSTLNESALDALSSLALKDRAQVQAILTRIEHQLERELSALLVPSSGFLSRPSAVAGSSREVELPEEDDLRRRILAWDHALVQEKEGIQKLRKALKVERRALEEDEGRLVAFEDARLKVEQKEQRDSSKALHPLVAELMKPDDEPDELALGDILAKKDPSNKWIAEAARVVDSKPLKGPDDEFELDEEDEKPYEPAKDPYLAQLQAERVRDCF